MLPIGNLILVSDVQFSNAFARRVTALAGNVNDVRAAQPENAESSTSVTDVDPNVTSFAQPANAEEPTDAMLLLKLINVKLAQFENIFASTVVMETGNVVLLTEACPENTPLLMDVMWLPVLA
jgi:hypothetical protein